MSSSTHMTHVLLLRGINVGGKHRLPMADLRRLLKDAGCEAAETYIQSGNAVVAMQAKLAKQIVARVEAGIESEFAFRVPIVWRSASAFREAVANNPFSASVPDEKALSVGLLASKPTRAALAALDPERSPGDRFEVIGQEIFLDCPNGVARTKLTNAYFDSKLGTVTTFRNWKTIHKLLEMLA